MSDAVLAAALIGCAWPCAGERKNNLSLNRNDDDKYLRYKDEMTSVVLESFPHCLVRINQVGGVGMGLARVLLMVICVQESRRLAARRMRLQAAVSEAKLCTWMGRARTCISNVK